MAKLTVQATTEVTVNPTVAAQLSETLEYYQALKTDAAALEAQMEIEKIKIKALLDEAGISKATIDGIPLTMATRDTSSLDKVRFVELGGSLAMLDNATVVKTGKPYLVIGKAKG